MYKLYLKRNIDFIIALIILAFFLPFLLIICLLLVLIQKKVFYVQTRIGINGKSFKMYKLKTMVDLYDSSGQLLPDELRITKLGMIIRSFSLDELPQLINVIIGDMSIVGPRPLLVDYLPLYSKNQAKRHLVRPGITGWAQVNGRNNISWKQKFELDVWYVENITFLLDCKIILLTILNVIKQKDIKSKTSISMERFNGNN